MRPTGASLPVDAPLVTSRHDGRRRVVAAADAAARAAGLRPGMALAHAQAMLPDLLVVEAQPEADAMALRELAAWCLRYAPLAAADPPDGLWIDVTGAAHLHGGEQALLADLRHRLRHAGYASRAAVAATPAAAHALARFGRPGCEDLRLLPVESLRLPEQVPGLRRLGLERVGQLEAAARGPLARRFGRDLLVRLDQMLGWVAEPITPVLPRLAVSQRLAFAEPLLTAEAFAAVIAALAVAVCAALERAGQGARRLDLLFERVDGDWQAIRVGTARPSRDAAHLTRLLLAQLETVDPGLGVEAMRLVAPSSERLAYTQTEADGMAHGADGAEPDIAELVDRLTGRLGAARVWRAAMVESDIPERSVRRVPALAPPTRMLWPASLPRPSRLFHPPQPIEALALLPDHPPAQFTWRRLRHRVRRADGPERVFGEWWRSDAELAAVRDYFRVEDEAGRRFWLYRQGDGVDPATGDHAWFLHGMF